MKKVLYFLSLVLIFNGCSKDSPAAVAPLIPTAAKLVFPFENSLCNEGTKITATESTVLFEWEEGENTDNFELKLRNLTTGDITSHETTIAEISIVLQRANPYDWYVISKSNSVSEPAQSGTWKFYNAGEGNLAYTPFPAEIISPDMAEVITTTANFITLDWNGNDVDDDIIGYDVYFGVTASPEIIQSDITESIVNNVPITPNTIYFWKIITKDSQGNKSDSGVFQFKIL